ncbi:GTP-binding protein A [Stylophora pistillata]|uniref:GTP-binding protein A n=1 Tax=Stylophora pistillata TaxID=50429 RepID=A0A2B4R8T5_STYPI|nr:GTP-binding protein A [Stylophora pistillata]
MDNCWAGSGATFEPNTLLLGCSKAFTASSSLNVHICKHTGLKPFKCNTEGCTKIYTTAANLRALQKRHGNEAVRVDFTDSSQCVMAADLSAVSCGSISSEAEPEVLYTTIGPFHSSNFSLEDATRLSSVGVYLPSSTLCALVSSTGNPLVSPTNEVVLETEKKQSDDGEIKSISGIQVPITVLQEEFVTEGLDSTFKARAEMVKGTVLEGNRHTGRFDLCISSMMSHITSETDQEGSGTTTKTSCSNDSNKRSQSLDFRDVHPEDQFAPPAVIFQDEIRSSDSEHEAEVLVVQIQRFPEGASTVRLPKELLQINLIQELMTDAAAVTMVHISGTEHMEVHTNDSTIHVTPHDVSSDISLVPISSLTDVSGERRDIGKGELSPYLDNHSSSEQDDGNGDTYPENCGKHQRAIERETLFDKAALEYAEHQEGQPTMVPVVGTVSSPASDANRLVMSWALQSGLKNEGTMVPESRPSNEQLALVKHFYNNAFLPHYRKDFNILVMGTFGSGKSTLVNSLLCKIVAEEGDTLKEYGDASEARPYTDVINGITVRIWDSPGLEDGTERDDLYLQDLVKKVSAEEIHLLVYCLKMTDSRFSAADKRTMKKLTKTFGQGPWKHTVIALTFANHIQGSDVAEKTVNFDKKLQHWKVMIPKFFSDEINRTRETNQFPPIMPTGFRKKQSNLPQQLVKWRSEFWLSCFEVAGYEAGFNLLLMSGPFPGRSNEIPFDDDQKEKIWRRTWDILKERCATIVGGAVALGAIAALGYTALPLILL